MNIIRAGCLLVASSLPAFAGEAGIVKAALFANADGSYRLSATVLHDDTGWAHYADGFEVLTLDGTLLASRVLAHPHVGEMPFTRDLSSFAIPDGHTMIVVRAHDLVDGYGGQELKISVPAQ